MKFISRLILAILLFTSLIHRGYAAEADVYYNTGGTPPFQAVTLTNPLPVTGGGTPGAPSYERIQDGRTTTLGTIKPASTPPAATDTSVIVAINPNSSLGASKHLISSTLTKISGAGTYTGATTTAPQAICLFASVTACAPVTITISSVVATVNGYLTRVTLDKSTTGATAATFRVLLYQTAPTLTGVFNTSTYLPLAADILSAAYVGSWECTTQQVNTDNSYYDCSPNAPNGTNAFSLTDGVLRAVVVATGAYVSGSSETFNVGVDVLASVP
jgi:hypothetical protein